MQLVARDIMNRDVLCVQKEWSITRAAEFLSEYHITGAPVVDSEGNILGVVSATDIARYASRHLTDRKLSQQESDYYISGWENRLKTDELSRFHLEDSMPGSVTSIMTPIIYSVEEDCPIFEMAEIMIRHRIHRLLITNGKLLVGIVSTLDLLRILARPGKA